LSGEFPQSKILCNGHVTERKFFACNSFIIKDGLCAGYVTERKKRVKMKIKRVFLSGEFPKSKILCDGHVTEREFLIVTN